MKIIYTLHALEQMKERKLYKGHYYLLHKMKIRYDADALYIKLREEEIDHTKEIDENTIIDFSKEGEVIGVEILFVKERNPNLLKEFQVENLIAV